MILERGFPLVTSSNHFARSSCRKSDRIQGGWVGTRELGRTRRAELVELYVTHPMTRSAGASGIVRRPAGWESPRFATPGNVLQQDPRGKRACREDLAQGEVQGWSSTKTFTQRIEYSPEGKKGNRGWFPPPERNNGRHWCSMRIVSLSNHAQAITSLPSDRCLARMHQHARRREPLAVRGHLTFIPSSAVPGAGDWVSDSE